VQIEPVSGLALQPVTARAEEAAAGQAPAAEVPAPAAGGGSGAGSAPEFARHMLDSDMLGLGPDGKPTGQKATFTGASKADAIAEEAGMTEMKLTQEEQDILNGSKGEEMAKLMKILVVFGNIFGAEKLVDLGGAPHSNLFTGAPYLGPLIKIFDQCAKAGLEAYAPYTVNPRPYDAFNIQNNLKELQLIYEGFKLQKDMDWMHARLGAPDLNPRACAC
jgi:hypothetical protein